MILSVNIYVARDVLRTSRVAHLINSFMEVVMNTKSKLSKAVAALAFVAAASSVQAANVFQEFTVAEGSVAGALTNTFVADKLNGGYAEYLTINTDLTFSSVAYGDIGQFYKNEGSSTVSSQLGSFTPNQYGMYALFDSSGLLTPGGFVGTAGNFHLWIDPNSDTTKALTESGNVASVALTGTADDYEILFSIDPTKLLGLPGTPGAYDFIFKDLVLTAAGGSYFIAPSPFHAVVDVNGDFDAFNDVVNDVNSRIAAGTFTTTTYKGSQGTGLTGDVSAVFVVPEPASLALVGFGLFAAGMSRRRKSA